MINPANQRDLDIRLEPALSAPQKELEKSSEASGGALEAASVSASATQDGRDRLVANVAKVESDTHPRPVVIRGDVAKAKVQEAKLDKVGDQLGLFCLNSLPSYLFCSIDLAPSAHLLILWVLPLHTCIDN